MVEVGTKVEGGLRSWNWGPCGPWKARCWSMFMGISGPRIESSEVKDRFLDMG